ncbi:hypothetical protein [Streptomyces albipurpureus]|uniref:Transcriptional regulator n=1 Tax=Streptomyces albipurpureus TaxID=2897419 RepID=A0ABT0V0V5_9ACTN|nr:hypothetical protein [Streptomyces sp. CWNU-1]MCM2393520.1 hypothetical protein [Streptomyces sp. CWNU-1]
MTRATRFGQLVRDRGWTYETFSAHFGRAARDVAQRSGDRRLASLMVSRSTFERWMAGDIKNVPRSGPRRILEHLFGEPAAVLFSSPDTPTHLPDLGILALATPELTTDDPYLAAMETFRNTDRRQGGSSLYPAVLHYLRTTLGPVLFGATAQSAGETAFRAAAVLTEMAGWMAHDTGRDALARNHFTHALRLARGAAAPSVAGNVLAAMSHLALQNNGPDHALQLARTGLASLHGSAPVPMLAARLHTMKARALAQRQDHTGAVKALDAARRQLDQIPAEPVPDWIAPFDRAAFTSGAAWVHHDLGDLSAAAVEAQRAVTLRGPERRRSRAFSQLCLARILLAQGELEGACAVGHDLLNACADLGSERITEQLTGLERALAPERAQSAVGELLTRITNTARHRQLLFPTVPVGTGPGGEQSPV